MHNAAEYINTCKDGGYIIFLDADGHMENGANAFGFLKMTPEKQVNMLKYFFMLNIKLT